MREETDDVTTERLVRLAVRLAAVMPRTRGYRVGAEMAASASIRPRRVYGSLLQSR